MIAGLNARGRGMASPRSYQLPKTAKVRLMKLTQHLSILGPANGKSAKATQQVRTGQNARTRLRWHRRRRGCR